MASYSPVTYTLTSGTVATPVFGYGTIDFLTGANLAQSDQLVVSLNGDVLTLTTDYTLDEGAEELTIVGATAAALQVGDVLLIERQTKRDSRYVDFSNGDDVDQSTLDLSADQNFFLIQELLADTNNLITLDVTTGRWDGKGASTDNFLPAVTSSGLVTLGQVYNIIEGGDTAVVDHVSSWVFAGDGAETDFTLTGSPSGSYDDDEVQVYVEGVRQIPGTHYTVDDTSTLIVQMNEAPVDGAAIFCYIIQGSVKAVLSTSSIDGSSLVSGSVSLAALDLDSGDARRVFFVTSSGVADIRTIVAADIADAWDARAALKEFSALKKPTAALDVNGQKISSLQAGSSANDAVTKSQMETYVDSEVATQLAAASVGNASVSGSFTVSGPGSLNKTVNLGFTPSTVIYHAKGTLSTDSKNYVLKFPETQDGITVSKSGSSITFTGSFSDGSLTVYYTAIE